MCILETPDLRLKLGNIFPTQTAAIAFAGHPARIIQHSYLKKNDY